MAGSDTIDEILNWPAVRFESVYSALVKAQSVQAIERQKEQMIAAMYSNPNWDDKENDRPGKMKEIEKEFARAMEAVYDPQSSKTDIDWNHPFWKAAARAHGKQLELDDAERGSTVRDAFQLDDGEIEHRARLRMELDQA